MEADASARQDLLRYRQEVHAALAVCMRVTERAFSRVSVREFQGSPNDGTTEQTFKMMLVTAFTALYPEFTLETEREVDGGRIDLLIVHCGYVEVVELKYIRAGFLKCVRFSTNHRAFLGSIRSALQIVRSHENPVDMKYSKKQKQGRTFVTTLRSIQEECEAGIGQAERYTDALVHGDINPLPGGVAWAVGYTVLCGIGPRVVCYRQHQVYLPDDLPPPSDDTDSSESREEHSVEAVKGRPEEVSEELFKGADE